MADWPSAFLSKSMTNKISTVERFKDEKYKDDRLQAGNRWLHHGGLTKVLRRLKKIERGHFRLEWKSVWISA
jgi:hypothetical protein